MATRLVIGFLFLLALAISVRAQHKILLPLAGTPQGNALTVNARINGHIVTLIVDTGSTLSQCDLRICGRASKVTTSLRLGTWESSEEVRTKDFAEVSKQCGTHIDGILGLLTMKRFKRVVLNFEDSDLELWTE